MQAVLSGRELTHGRTAAAAAGDRPRNPVPPDWTSRRAGIARRAGTESCRAGIARRARRWRTGRRWRRPRRNWRAWPTGLSGHRLAPRPARRLPQRPERGGMRRAGRRPGRADQVPRDRQSRWPPVPGQTPARCRHLCGRTGASSAPAKSPLSTERQRTSPAGGNERGSGDRAPVSPGHFGLSRNPRSARPPTPR